MQQTVFGSSVVARCHAREFAKCLVKVRSIIKTTGNGKLGNMNVEEAVLTAQKIGARMNVPCHYDMFASNSENPKLFTEKVAGGIILEFNREWVLE